MSVSGEFALVGAHERGSAYISAINFVSTKPSSGNWFVDKDTSGKWFTCPAGTTAAAIPADQSADMFCEGIDAGYYGTVGNAASAHATVTSCGTGFLSTAGSTAVEDCYKSSAATNTFAKAGTSNKYFKCPAGTTAAAAPSGTGANTFCEGIDAGYYGTVGNAASAHAVVTVCPTGTSNGASTSNQARETCFAGSAPSSVPAGAGGFFVVSGQSKWFVCKEGATASSMPSVTSSNTFCTGIAPGYYGAAGTSSAHANPTACTATFSHALNPSAGITSTASTTTTTKTACKTAPGYIITSSEDAADGSITVAAAAAGTYAAGGTALVSANAANKGTATETATNCDAGKYSAAGAASCSNCATGKTNDAGSAFCGKVAAGYYGTVGSKSGSTFTGHAGTVTACTATYLSLIHISEPTRP